MEELFEQLQDDTRSFWQSPSSGVRRLDTMPLPADFFRDYVATSTPVILSGGGCFKGDGGSCWDDLSSLAGRDSEGLEVTVDFTPDGRGDCVVDVGESMLSECPTSDADVERNSNTEGDAVGVEGSRRSCRTGGAVNGGAAAAASCSRAVFVKPEERRMKFETFVSTLLMEAAARAGGESSSTRECASGSGVGKGVPYLSHQVRLRR